MKYPLSTSSKQDQNTRSMDENHEKENKDYAAGAAKKKVMRRLRPERILVKPKEGNTFAEVFNP